MNVPTLREAGRVPFHISAWCAAGGRVYVGMYRDSAMQEQDNTFRCYGADWQETWKCKAEMDPEGIAAYRESVIGLTWGITTWAGYLQRMEGDTGAIIWQRKLTSPSPQPAPTVVGDHVCVVAKGQLVAFRADNGKPLWKHPVGQFTYPLMVWPDRGAIMVGQHDGSIACLDSQKGTVIWTRKLGNQPAVVCRSGDRLFAASTQGQLHALDPTDGRVLHTFDVEVWSNVVEQGSRLFFQTFFDNEEGYRIGAVDAAGMRLLWDVEVPFSQGNALYSPEPLGVTGDTLLVKTYAGPFYALDVMDGSMAWQVQASDLQGINPGVQKLGMPMLIDGRVWLQAGRYVYEVMSGDSPSSPIRRGTQRPSESQ